MFICRSRHHLSFVVLTNFHAYTYCQRGMQTVTRRSGWHCREMSCASGTLSEFICRSRCFSHCSSSELSCIYFMPAWHADHDPPQRLASQEDVLHIRPPLRDSSAAADSSHLVSAWYANCDPQQGLPWQGDVRRTRPPLRAFILCCSRQHLIFVVTNFYAYS